MALTPERIKQIKAAGITLEDLDAYEAQKSQASGGSDVNSLLAKLGVKTRTQNAGTGVGDFISRLGGDKPEPETDDYSKLIAQEAIKSQFEDPTVRQLREAEIEALKSPAPRGFFRSGKQLLPDPDYIDPKEQVAIDAEERQQQKARQEAEEADRRQAQIEEQLKQSAQDSLNTIEQVKAGSKYFGPFGETPTLGSTKVLGIPIPQMAPSTILSGGKEYGPRAKWESEVEKLLSQKVLDVMTELKNQSRTGATGLGNITEKELATLRSASTALNRKLDPQDALAYLAEMEAVHKKILGINTIPPESRMGTPGTRPTDQQVSLDGFIIEEVN